MDIVIFLPNAFSGQFWLRIFRPFDYSRSIYGILAIVQFLQSDFPPIQGET